MNVVRDEKPCSLLGIEASVITPPTDKRTLMLKPKLEIKCKIVIKTILKCISSVFSQMSHLVFLLTQILLH